LENPDLDLVEGWIECWRHHDIVVSITILWVNLSLLISDTRYGNRHLEIGGDLGEVLSVRVGESQPLVEHGMVLLEVDETEVKLKLSD
jgi:hypothetical protein